MRIQPRELRSPPEVALSWFFPLSIDVFFFFRTRKFFFLSCLFSRLENCDFGSSRKYSFVTRVSPTRVIMLAYFLSPVK